MKIIFSHASERDLKGIKDYISTDNPRVASKVVLRIVRHIRITLSTNPYSGRLSDSCSNDIRELIIPNLPYLACYTVSEDRISIIRIFHQSMKYWERLK